MPPAQPVKIPPSLRVSLDNLKTLSNPGEGNCLFHCFAQAKTMPEKTRSHRQLRAFAMNYMTKHWHRFQSSWDGLSPDNQPLADFNEYLTLISKNQAWGGYAEIAAYAAAVSKPVLVAHSEGGNVHVFNAGAANSVVVLHYQNEHYELALPTDEQLQYLRQTAEDATNVASKRSYRGAAKKCDSPRLSDFASVRSSCKRSRSSTDLSAFASSVGQKRKSSAALTQFASSRKSIRSNASRNSANAPLDDLSGPLLTVPPRSGKVDQTAIHTWKCNLCSQIFRGTTRQLTIHRLRHRKARHADVPSHMVAPRKTLISSFIEVSDIQMHLRSWTCCNCKLGLPLGLKYTARRNTALKHIQKRFKKPISFGENAKRCAKLGLSRHGAGTLPMPLPEGGRLHEWITLHHTKRFRNQVMSFCQTCACNKRAFTNGHCEGSAVKLRNLKKKWKQWLFLRKNHNADLAEWVQSWQLTKKHVLELDKVALRRSGVLPKAFPSLTKSRWWRDLTQDGDVESNPGPQPIMTMAFLNTNGYNGCWSALDHLAGKCDLLGLSETHTVGWQHDQVTQKLQHLGYRAWGIPANTTLDSLGRTRYHGGIIFALAITLPGVKVFETQGSHGSFLAFDLQQCFLGFLWARSGLTSDSEMWDSLLKVHAMAAQQHCPYLFAGDWNRTPAENCFLQTTGTLAAATDPDGSLIPTRWQTLRSVPARCIDYVVTVRLDNHKVSDRKIARCQWQRQVQLTPVAHMQTTVHYGKPAEVNEKLWRNAFSQFWEAAPRPKITGNANTEWQSFCDIVEMVHQQVRLHFKVKRFRHCERPKGSAPVALPPGTFSNKQISGQEHKGSALAKPDGQTA